MSKTPLNELCWDIEKWECENFTFGERAWTKNCEDIHKYLLDNDVEFIEENYWTVKKIYNEFNKNYNKIFRLRAKETGEIAEENFKNRIISLYERYRDKINKLDIDINEKVNYCVLASYVKDEKDMKKDKDKIKKANLKAKKTGKYGYKLNEKSTKFAWAIVGDEMIENLKKNSNDCIKQVISETTFDDINGEEYLGRYYKFIDYEGE